MRVRMIVNASSNRETRWSGKAEAAYSGSFHPAPRPSTSRPPLMSSTVAAFLAIIAGLWNEVEATRGPMSAPAGGLAQGGQHRPCLHGAPPRSPGRGRGEVLSDPYRVESNLLGRDARSRAPPARSPRSTSGSCMPTFI